MSSSDLVATMGLDRVLPAKKFLFVIKDDCCDSNFVCADLLSFLLKQKYSLLLLNCSQTQNHYYHLLSRTGLILKSLISSNRAIVIDVLQAIQEVVENEKVSADHPLRGYEDGIGLRTLFTCVTKAVSTLCQNKDAAGFVLFIDDINILLNIGIPTSYLRRFLHYCRVLCFDSRDVPGFLFVGGQEEPHDEEVTHFFNYLSSVTDMRILLQGLVTGYSKEVHGKILVVVKDECHKEFEVFQNLFFKVDERGTKLSAIGGS